MENTKEQQELEAHLASLKEEIMISALQGSASSTLSAKELAKKASDIADEAIEQLYEDETDK